MMSLCAKGRFPCGWQTGQSAFAMMYLHEENSKMLFLQWSEQMQAEIFVRLFLCTA